MNELTVEELEITLQCVKMERLKLSPVSSNSVEKRMLMEIESKLEKDLKQRKKRE